MTHQPRHAPRRPTNKAGIIKAGSREYAVLLRDATETGARLRLVGSPEIPERFQLVSALEKIDAACEVVWRRGSDVGVKFMPQTAS